MCRTGGAPEAGAGALETHDNQMAPKTKRQRNIIHLLRTKKMTRKCTQTGYYKQTEISLLRDSSSDYCYIRAAL